MKIVYCLKKINDLKLKDLNLIILPFIFKFTALANCLTVLFKVNLKNARLISRPITLRVKVVRAQYANL